MDLLKSLPSKRIDGTLVDHVVNIKEAKKQAGISSCSRDSGIHYGAHRRFRSAGTALGGAKIIILFSGVRLD